MTPGTAAPRVASLCAGYGGLDLAVHAVLGAELAWVAEIDPAASSVLAHRFPGVPNIGDITAADWAAVEPADILTAGFPCFPAGTLVTTDAGLRPIEELQIGDKVLTHRRHYRPVIQTMRREADQILSVKAMGAPAIATTAEHPFYVRDGRNVEPVWVPARELRYGMYLALPDTDVSEQSLTDGEISRWYLVGRWLGDGWTVTHKRSGRVASTAQRVHWCCAPEESEALEKAFAEAGPHPTKAPDRTAVKYVMQSAEWAALLGDFGKYAYGKHIPEYVHALPIPAQAALLRGWLDSDGDVKADGTLNGTTTSRALAVGMARIARTVHQKGVSIHAGGTPRANVTIEGRQVNERPWWSVRIPPGPSKRAFQADGFTWVPLRSVSKQDTPTEVFNIGVQDDESYVAEGVVVHNCQDVSCAGARKGLRAGTRTGVWSHVAEAIGVLRPSLVVLENVRGLLSAGADSDMEPCPWCLGDSGAEHALRALGAVLGDLSDLGYVGRYRLVSAAAAGAPHRRERVFITAWPAADSFGEQRERRGVPGILGGSAPEESRQARQRERAGHSAGDCSAAAPEDADGTARGERRVAAPGQAQAGRPRADPGRPGGAPAADAGRGGQRADERDLRQGQPDTDRGVPADAASGGQSARHRSGNGGGEAVGPEAAGRLGDSSDASPDADSGGFPELPERDSGTLSGVDRAFGDDSLGRVLEWGPYAGAISRWEGVTGRRAPRPTEPGRTGERLSPRFVEFLMGLPDGWVTAVPGLSRNQMLKILGNGVVPQQAELALRLLLGTALTAVDEAAA